MEIIDGVYFPEPLQNKPEWFNGFIAVEKHPKQKYGWSRYVYLPNFYTDNCRCGQISVTTRFGSVIPHIDDCKSISDYFVDYYTRTETKQFNTNDKLGIGGKALGTITLFNAATGKKENHRYLFANKEYIIRQLIPFDKHQVIDILQDATKSIQIFLGMTQFNVYLETGLSIAPINKKGELKGLQTFSIYEDRITAEPLTYVDPEARGQGIFSIYHEMSVDLGNAVGAEYVYAQCEADSKMRRVYESYGYIHKKSKWIGKHDPREVFMFNYPLQTNQKALF